MTRFLPIFVLYCAFSAWSQESVSEIKRTIKSVEQETAHEKELTAAESKRHASFVETSRQKAASLTQQEVSLKSQLDSMKAEIARLQEAKQKTVGGIRFYEAKKVRYAQDLAKMIDSVAPQVEMDFPYKNDESVTAIQETASQLRKGIIAPDEALGRVLEILLDRTRLGYTTEVWSGYLAYEGRSIPGKFLRYGAVASLFVSQSGDDIFWLSHTGEGFNWVSAGDNLQLRSDLKEAMKVAEGKTPPKLVAIPISTPKALGGTP